MPEGRYILLQETPICEGDYCEVKEVWQQGRPLLLPRHCRCGTTLEDWQEGSMCDFCLKASLRRFRAYMEADDE